MLDTDLLVIALAVGAPLFAVVAAIAGGVTQVRRLRRLTGDTSLVTTVLGFTFLRSEARPPAAPGTKSPERLKKAA